MSSGAKPPSAASDTSRAAAALAKKHPDLRLIVYRATGDPPAAAERIGKTWLVTPGEKAKHLLRLTYSAGEFGSYASISLGPEFKNDPDAARIYGQYLGRVSQERLLDKLPRQPTKAFAGSEACAKCHPAAAKAWKASGHSHALLTLEKEKHDRDPDCVGCHVVGLKSDKGFRSRQLTPKLANVGCESCHGPAAGHAKAPRKMRLPKVGAKSCAQCHVPENSPHFEFGDYWRKIAH
jgi:hypothetical protein